jgi:hypothetical protein
MELYLRWLAKHVVEAGENPPPGIILCTGKKHEQIELLDKTSIKSPSMSIPESGTDYLYPIAPRVNERRMRRFKST